MAVFLTNSGDVADSAGKVGISLNNIKLYTEKFLIKTNELYLHLKLRSLLIQHYFA